MIDQPALIKQRTTYMTAIREFMSFSACQDPPALKLTLDTIVIADRIWRHTQVLKRLTMQATIIPINAYAPEGPPVAIRWRLAAGNSILRKHAESGNQLSYADLLIATLARCLDRVVVTYDDAFDALPIQRENWRAAR